jgi:hypothetical protein
MLAFLYEAEYEPPPDINQWAFHAHIAAIADKYFIEPLEKYAENKFDHYHKNATALSEFPDAIVAAYDTENKSLRSMVIGVVKSNHPCLFSKRSECSAFKQVLRETPDFAAAVAEALAEQLGAASEKLSSGVVVSKKTMNSMKWYQCPSYACRDENTVFSLPARLRYSPCISCPLGCSDAHDRKSNWWAKYEVDNPLSPAK